MKTFKNQAAQGDVLFSRIEKIPTDAVLVDSKNKVVVAHSETGHDHIFRDAMNVKLFRTKDPFICYLRCESDAVLEHLREFDTHESIQFSAGSYEVRRQREFTPEGYRMVAD